MCADQGAGLLAQAKPENDVSSHFDPRKKPCPILLAVRRRAGADVLLQPAADGHFCGIVHSAAARLHVHRKSGRPGGKTGIRPERGLYDHALW